MLSLVCLKVVPVKTTGQQLRNSPTRVWLDYRAHVARVFYSLFKIIF